MSTSKPAGAVSVEVEIPFHDVDPLGVVWHGHYFKYMEIARTALLRGRGLDVAELLEGDRRLYIIESKCRHSAPLHYGDKARIWAWIKNASHSVTIGYEIDNLTTGRRAGRGHTVLAAVDSDGKLLLETPDELRSRLVDE